MDIATILWWALVIGGIGAVGVIGVAAAMMLANRKPDA